MWPQFGVAGDNGFLFAETLEQPNRRDSLEGSAAIRRYPVVRVGGLATSIGATWQNYCHRNVDMLPKLWLLHRPELQELGPVKLLLSETYPRRERELVSLLAPKGTEVVVVSPYRRFKVDSYLHLPQLSNHPKKDRDISKAGWLPAEYLQFFRRRVFDAWGLKQEQVQEDEKRYFVSRRKAAIRRLSNEKHVRSTLAERGFRVLELESMSLRDQAAAFNEASIIVAQHGAGLTNLLYARPGCRVIEIECQGASQGSYAILGDKLALRYQKLESIPKEPSGTARRLADVDSVLDLRSLQLALDDN